MCKGFTEIDVANMNLPDGCKLVFSHADIIHAIDVLADRLNQQFNEPLDEVQNKSQNRHGLLVLCVMQGGLIFSGHLIPRLNCMLEIDYIHVSRYSNKTAGGELLWKAYPHTSLKHRNILILDDILDEGHTLKSIIEYCIAQGANTVESAVLLKKTHDRCVDSQSDSGSLTENIALTVEDKYVFGFGMDYHGDYRQLDSIYALHD